MKSSIHVVAIALAALGVFVRPGLSQQYLPPGFAAPGQAGYAPPGAGYGPGASAAYGYPGADPGVMTAPSPYAPSPYAASFGVAQVGYRQPPAPGGAVPPDAFAPAEQYAGPIEGAIPMDGPPPMHDGTMHHDSSYEGGFLEGDCEDCGGAGCGACGRNPRFWSGISYFVNWRSDRNLPALVTTSPDGTAFGNAGLLPDATVLVGGDVGGERAGSGGKVFGGMWLDELHEVAIGGGFWAVDSDPQSFFFASDGSAGSLIIAQPFESTLTNAPSRAIVAFPGFSSGDVRVNSKQYNTFGGDIYLQTNWHRTPVWSVDLLAGYVTSRMDDLLTIRAHRTSIGPNGPPPFGATLNFNEFFRTQNEFHGGELGITTQLQSANSRWSLNLTGKCGFGGMTERLRIRGTTVTSAGGLVVVTPGGLYTQPTNIGDYEQTKFAFAPEIEARMNYWVARRLGVSVGYQFFYWSDVALAGDQVDTTINPTQFGGGALVGPARPRAIFNTSDFWLQGLTFGVVGQF